LQTENEQLNLAVEGLTAENKVVHKENDELIEKVERLTEERENMQAVIFGLEEEKRQAVKDTAKEILEAVDKESSGQTLSVTNVLRKRYGVEVE
jgi:cell division septum initiation protein DivIVA